MKNTRPSPLRVVRQLRGFSQCALATTIGRSQAWLCQVELGYIRPSQHDLARIADVLAVDPDLIGDNDEPLDRLLSYLAGLARAERRSDHQSRSQPSAGPASRQDA